MGEISTDGIDGAKKAMTSYVEEMKQLTEAEIQFKKEADRIKSQKAVADATNVHS